MNAANAKWFQLFAPGLQAASSQAGGPVDTAGFGFLEVVFEQAAFAAGVTATALKLDEGDSSTTATTDITGAIAGTSTPLGAAVGAGSNLPSTSTNSTLQVFNIDLKGRKRWISLVLTASSSTSDNISAIARLSRGDLAPNTAGEYGANQVFSVPQVST